MEKIGLLVDSTSLTNKEIIKKSFVKVASLKVRIDEKEYQEVAIPYDEMLLHLKNAKKLLTSQPSPGEFFDLYKKFSEEGYTNVLVITLSEKLSGTFQSALIAKSMVDFPIDIRVMAPQTASFGVALGITELIKMIDNGSDFETIMDRAHTLYEHPVVMFTLSNLMHLFKGGRLNLVSALLGSVLRIKPIVEMQQGRLQLTKKERTNIACFDYFTSEVDKYAETYETVVVDFIELNHPEWADKFSEYMSAKHPTIQVHYTHDITPVFSVHLGDTGFGIAMLAEHKKKNSI